MFDFAPKVFISSGMDMATWTGNESCDIQWMDF